MMDVIDMAQSEVWTNTSDTYVDHLHSNKFINYGGIEYVAQCLNFRGEIKQKPAEYEYRSVSERIQKDAAFMQRSYQDLKPAMYGKWAETLYEPATNETDPTFANPYFSASDARAAYALVEIYKPKLIIEVGSGNSTKFFRRSIEDNSLDTKICSIDPSPRTPVHSIVDKLVATSVCDVDLKTFDALDAGDVLFWDGCHICFNGSDVCTLFLEVLPKLKPGIFVHVHDIYLPFAGINMFAGTPPDVSVYSPSEQLMLATYILNASQAKVMLPLQYMKQKGIADETGVSFWFVTG